MWKDWTFKIQTAEKADEKKDDPQLRQMSRGRSIKECEKAGLLKLQTAEEAAEKEDDRNYDKCPEHVVLKECEKSGLFKNPDC